MTKNVGHDKKILDADHQARCSVENTDPIPKELQITEQNVPNTSRKKDVSLKFKCVKREQKQSHQGTWNRPTLLCKPPSIVQTASVDRKGKGEITLQGCQRL